MGTHQVLIRTNTNPLVREIWAFQVLITSSGAHKKVHSADPPYTLSL